MAISTYLSIITLNVNGLSVPFKGHSMAEQVRKRDATYAAYKTLTSDLKTHTDGLKGYGKQIFHANRNEKKKKLEQLYLDQIDFKTNTVTKHKNMTQ